jgi:hypothetical protein
MSDKPEDNYIDQLFRDSIDNVETEPSDQFWNKAYETILQNENKAYVSRIRMWRTVAAVLAVAVLALISFNVYTRYNTNGIEQKMTGQEKSGVAVGNNQQVAVNASNTVVNAASQNSLVVADNAGKATSAAQTPAVNVNQRILNYGRSGNRSGNGVSSPQMAYNNSGTQHSRTHIASNVGAAYNAIYLDDRTTITIPAPDKMDSNLLAMDVDDKSSVGSRHIEEEENIIPTRPKPKFGPRLSISVYGAQSIAEPIIKNNNSDDKVTASDITAREQQEAAYSFGANAGYDLSRKLTVQLGCEYRSYKFSLAPTAVNINTGDWNSGYSFVTSSGIITMPYISGYTRKGYDTTATAKGNAVRNYISVPLAIKYKFLSDPKVSLYVRAGTSFNVLTSNYANMHVQNSLGEEDVYVNNIQGSKEINFSYLLGFGAVCRLWRGVDLYVEPAYSGAITANTVSSPISTYSCFFDLTGGLIYHF